MFKKFLIGIGAYVLVLITLGAVKAEQIKKMSSMNHTPPPSAVATFEARAEKWAPTLSAIGTLAPVQGVTISADADGTLLEIKADNGTKVKAGDTLFVLDSSVERAQLEAAQSRADLAHINLDRAHDLWKQNVSAKAEFDTADASYKQAMADVASLQATIAKKTVRAPFDGRVGIRMVNVGQYISRGQPLIPLEQLDPIYVNFSVPQRQLPQLIPGRPVGVKVDAFGDTAFDGKISAIDSRVDSATRNIAVQALLKNPDEKLRAGMFAEVKLVLPDQKDVVVVPSTAINYAPYGNSVFIVEQMKGDDGNEYLGVRQQFVKLGDTKGDLIAITDGVKPGEVVVSAGGFKLRNHAPVQVNNEVQPDSSATPHPANT